MEMPHSPSTSPRDGHPAPAAGKENGIKKARVDYPIYLNLPDTAYEYTPLPTEESHVRLLMLIGLRAPLPSPDGIKDDKTRSSISAAGEEPLRAILFTTPLSNVEAQYIALSYTWGTENTTNAIRTPTGILYITSNLDSALRRLLNICGSGIFIWADAVCIDQCNHAEKAAQICLMPKIYQHAHQVAAYLGADDADSDDAIKLMARVAKCNFDDEKASPRDLEDLERCGLPAWNDKAWVSLHQFIGRPWFRRVWIVQECILARNLEFFWGNERTLPFGALRSIVARLFKLGFPVIREARENVGVPPIDSKTVVRGWNCLLNIVMLQKGWERGERDDLLLILNLCRDAETTVKRDKYFALVGLSKAAHDLNTDPDLRPDYTEPFVDVSIRYTRYLLKSYEGAEAIRILSLAQPRFPDLTLPSLPSWVPDWNQRLEVNTLVDLYPGSKQNQLYRTALFSPPALRVDESQDGRTLVVRGAKFQSVTFVGNDYWIEHRGKDIKAIILDLMKDVGIHGQSIKSYPTREPMLETLWKTVTLNKYSSSASPTCLSAFSNKMAMVSSVSAARKIFESCARLEMFTDPDLQAARRAFTTFSELLRGWKFTILAGDYVGMVPITAEKSDLVVIVSGAEVPYVLRSVPGTREPARYTLVGECYVHGIMQGELLDSKIDLSWEEFRLI